MLANQLTLLSGREKSFRNIYYNKNHYLDFFATLKLISILDRVPEKYFKHLTGSKGIYEIRIEVGPDIYRVFSFFGKGHLVVLVNGFQKKSRKTPSKEIELAKKLKKQYFYEKDK
jgi:phage-related protein